MELHVLGAGCEVGRSCILLTIGGRRLLFDCGAHPGFDDENRFPAFQTLPTNLLKEIDAILISHYHFDHAGAIPFLTETLSCLAPVYMTEPTKEFARLMLLDFVSTSKTRKQYCPFSEREVEGSLQRVKLLPLEEQICIGDEQDILVKAFYAGHAIGAVMFFVQIAGKTVLYSGDYCTKSDGYLRAANPPLGLSPDVLITEATYCNSIRKESLFEQENSLVDSIVSTIAKEGKVLIPIPALGKAQGICSMLSKHLESTALQDVPMYITEGLASKANDLYIKFSEWTTDPSKICWHCEQSQGGRKRSRFQDRCKHNLLETLRPFNRNEHWNLLYQKGPMILFATPGNMSTGISHDVFKLWGSHPQNLVIVPSFWFTNTVSISSCHVPEMQQTDSIPSNVRCRLLNQISNVHTDKRGIVRMCKKVQSKAIVLVHGERGKVKQFQDEVRTALNVPCYAPETGEVLRIMSRADDELVTSSSSSKSSSLFSSDWKSIASSYVRMAGEANDSCSHPSMPL